MKYRVKIEQTDEGYAISCPGLPASYFLTPPASPDQPILVLSTW